MAMSVEEKNKKIRGLLNKYLADYIPMQEIIHVCDQLEKIPTEAEVHEMMDYLMEPDKEFIVLQTANIKAIINNHVRLCMAKVVKVINGEAIDDEEGV